jgi:small subunit ribosomal protein S3
MGQKVNPIGFASASTAPGTAVGSPTATSTASCCTRTSSCASILKERLKQAGISRIVIERPHKKCRVTIHAARPGVVIGKKGADIEKLRKDLSEMTEGRDAPQHRRSAQAGDRRSAGRRVDRSAARAPRRFPSRHEARVQSAMRLGAEGIRINCSGRLGGAEIARMEWYREGRVPLHTLRADIDYGTPKPRPPTASAASRSGSSRARSWSTTRWRRQARWRR